MKDEARCEICEKRDVVLVGMQPGPDGQPWWLCIRDYIDGLFPGKLGRIDPKYKDPPGTPVVASRKRKAG